MCIKSKINRTFEAEVFGINIEDEEMYNFLITALNDLELHFRISRLSDEKISDIVKVLVSLVERYSETGSYKDFAVDLNNLYSDKDSIIERMLYEDNIDKKFLISIISQNLGYISFY